MKDVGHTKKAVSLLSAVELKKINDDLRNPIDYRKSGLSLNHIVGCPLDCSYCVRHIFDSYDMRTPKAIMSDDEAVAALLSHNFFQRNITPLQLFNRATDPFLPNVKPHTFHVLNLLDQQRINNHVLLITRYHVNTEDCHFLNSLIFLRVTVLVTYSGIDDAKIEPVNSNIAVKSLKTLYENAVKYKVIMYWRPIIPGVNDSDRHIERAIYVAKYCHAIATTGLFFRQQMVEHFDKEGIEKPYDEIARRKILPQVQEGLVLSRLIEARLLDSQVAPIFRKTSCAISYAHRAPDYNGHYGIREICDICPESQVAICANSWTVPSISKVSATASKVGINQIPTISDQAVSFHGVPEQERYYVQHTLEFQCHDSLKPHHAHLHGRADIGWDVANEVQI